MARLAALNLIEDVMGKGLPLQESIARSREYDALDARDRRFCRRIISLTLRHHGEASAILAPHLNRPPKGKNRKAGFVLMMAVTEMIMGGGEPHAVVDQSVRLVKAVELAHLGGLTNAVLRKIAAEAETLKARPADAWANLPTWLARAIRADWPDQADAVAASLMMTPPLDLSLKNTGGDMGGDNTRHWAEQLGGTPLPNGSIRLTEGHVPALPGYDDGAWWVQDAAASLPARLMGDIAGKRVADICAAPGGKTAQLFAAGADVTAIDVSANRLERLNENMARLGFSPQIVVADATRWRPDTKFDAIMIDAPCSATGTIRRRPDILCHDNAPDFASLRQVQSGLLAAAADLVRPGGVVIFATCSLLKREGEGIITKAPETLRPMPFTEAELNLGFRADTSAGGHALRLMPNALRLDSTADMPQGNDGFFISRFERAAE